MAVTTITLSDPSSGLVVPLRPVAGVAVSGIDASAPARGVVESRVGARGGVDTTAYTDAGVLSLTMLLWPDPVAGVTPEGFLDSIAPLLDPRLRVVLTVANDAWPGARRAVLRYDSIAKPWTDPTQWPVQINWTVPDACWEDATVTSAVINAFATDQTGVGLVFDVPGTGLTVTSAGLTFPATASPAPSQVINPGTAAAQWTALLYGPATGPKLANDALGLKLEFTDDLSISAGNYLALDSQAQSALLNGDPLSDVTGALNFSSSTWWLMNPGINVIRYYPSDADAGAQATLSFRGAYPL
jgi:hypothetical protein